MAFEEIQKNGLYISPFLLLRFLLLSQIKYEFAGKHFLTFKNDRFST